VLSPRPFYQDQDPVVQDQDQDPAVQDQDQDLVIQDQDQDQDFSLKTMANVYMYSLAMF